MPTPHRRSSRIRGRSATPGKSIAHTPSLLASLSEREESLASATPSRLEDAFPSVPRTPLTGHIKPPSKEMHPSKAQQSTVKKPDSGLRLGFADIGASKAQQTPSKPMPESPFEFRFARPGPTLSADAQKMMDDLRGEALRVKARLVAEREEAAKNGEAAAPGITGRKIAQAKGKVGRFSDVHMAEFKRMDSIADHPSSFRSQAVRSTPVKPALKRSQSQAKLDEREDVRVQPSNTKPSQTERLENDAPAKRARKCLADDASTIRRVSRDGKPSTPQKQAGAFAYTAPTQSSLSHAASVKKTGSQIPTLSRSPSKPSLVASPQIPNLSRSPSKPNLTSTPHGLPRPINNAFGGLPRSEPKPFMRSPGKVERLKSMLRYPSASAKKSAASSAFPTSILSPPKPDFNKELPSLPTTPGGLERSKSVKHVSFTPETVVKNAHSMLQSPSPTKTGIPRSISRPRFFANNVSGQSSSETFKPSDVTYPSIANHPSVRGDAKPVDYPTLTSVRPLPAPPPHLARANPPPPPPAVPGTFTFRSDHTINFGPSPAGFGSSPGQASVRQVRQSIFPTMPGSFPGPGSNKENGLVPVPSTAHGIPNKKRHRADSDDDDDEEKGEAAAAAEKKQKTQNADADVERSPKKLKTHSAHGQVLTSRNLGSAAAAPPPLPARTPSPEKKKLKKKGLSLSRLNMLSRPKMRK